MRKENNEYEEWLKKEVVLRVKSKEMSAWAARKIYGIGGKMTVYKWLKRYELTKEDIRTIRRKMVKKKRQQKEKNKEQLLKEAQLKIEYYEIIMSQAKEEYGIDFKKILASSGKKTFKE